MSDLLGKDGGRRIVALPLARHISRTTVRKQFGVSRQTISKWRARHGFPKADETGEIEAAAILAWARLHNVQIEWV